MSDRSPYLGSRLWLDPAAVTAAEEAACGGVHARASLAIPTLDFSVCACSCDCGHSFSAASVTLTPLPVTLAPSLTTVRAAA